VQALLLDHIGITLPLEPGSSKVKCDSKLFHMKTNHAYVILYPCIWGSNAYFLEPICPLLRMMRLQMRLQSGTGLMAKLGAIGW
jgi:hypothetical protein